LVYRKLLIIFFLWDWGLNLRLCACKAGALLHESHLQYILLWLFLEMGLMNYLPRLALNCDPLDLSLPSC
jgi:hypothetical protein